MALLRVKKGRQIIFKANKKGRTEYTLHFSKNKSQLRKKFTPWPKKPINGNTLGKLHTEIKRALNETQKWNAQRVAWEKDAPSRQASLARQHAAFNELRSAAELVHAYWKVVQARQAEAKAELARARKAQNGEMEKALLKEITFLENEAQYAEKDYEYHNTLADKEKQKLEEMKRL